MSISKIQIWKLMKEIKIDRESMIHAKHRQKEIILRKHECKTIYNKTLYALRSPWWPPFYIVLFLHPPLPLETHNTYILLLLNFIFSFKCRFHSTVSVCPDVSVVFLVEFSIHILLVVISVYNKLLFLYNDHHRRLH